jgi:hypothetical protein
MSQLGTRKHQSHPPPRTIIHLNHTHPSHNHASQSPPPPRTLMHLNHSHPSSCCCATGAVRSQDKWRHARIRSVANARPRGHHNPANQHETQDRADDGTHHGLALERTDCRRRARDLGQRSLVGGGRCGALAVVTQRARRADDGVTSRKASGRCLCAHRSRRCWCPGHWGRCCWRP